MPHKIHAHKLAGFTLIEILISIAIISLVGIFFFPNLRKFNTNQKFQNEVLDVKNVIKKAQANASTSTRCTSSEPALSWSVKITKSTMVTTLVGNCLNSSGGTTSRTMNTVSPSNITLQTTLCSSGTTIELKFDRTGFSYSCNGTTFTQQTFSLPLQNKNTTSQSNTISINTLGTISQN